DRSGFGDVDCRDSAKSNAFGFADNIVVLKNPRACAALADADPETADVGIEVGDFGPAPGQVEGGEIRLVEAHGTPSRWGRAWAGRSVGQPTPSEAKRLQVPRISTAFIGLPWPAQPYLISFWVLQVAGSNPAAPTKSQLFEHEETPEHDGPHLQAREDGNAVRHRKDQGMGARLRARTTARDRAAHGLDQFGRHASAGAAAFRYARGSGRLLSAPRHWLSGLQVQPAGAARHVVCRQLFGKPPRSMDALSPERIRQYADRKQWSRPLNY